ncbi:MAG: cell division protein FtsX [Sphingomonas sp.]
MKVRVVTTAAAQRMLDEQRQTRSMRWIMAIMLFLTVLSAALGLGTAAASRLLDRQLAGRLTVQIVEANAARREAAAASALAVLRALPQVARAGAVDRAALSALLRPWLGDEGADPDLPIPAMIDVDLAARTDAGFQRVRSAVQAAVPTARIDRHESWLAPVSGFLSIVAGFAAALVAMMAAATAIVVLLAARAGLDTHRYTIDVLHMLGSTDRQIARLFQRRIALDTLIGGAIGTMFAVAAVLFLGLQAARLGSDLLDGVGLGAWDWLVLAMLPVAFALLAMLSARMAVLRALRKVL